PDLRQGRGDLMVASLHVRWLRVLPLVVLSALSTGGAAAGTAPDDDEPFLPGLTATYRDTAGTTATRLDYRLSFHWGDAAPDSRLAAGQFSASWGGLLQTTTKGDYRFFLFGTGE